MYDQLRDLCLELAADRSVRMVVVRGAGGVFAAGTDVADLVTIRNGADGVAYEGEITRVLDAVRALPVPLVALVEGPAVGVDWRSWPAATWCTRHRTLGSVRPVARTLGNCFAGHHCADARGPRPRSRHRTPAHRAAATAEEALSAGLVRAIVQPGDLDAVVADLLVRVSRCDTAVVAAAKELGRRLDHHKPPRNRARRRVRQVFDSATSKRASRPSLTRPPEWRGE